MGEVWMAFLLTTIAGLSTGIGSLIAFFTKKDNKKFLAVCLGFSAGVMIYVSMVELFQEAQDALISALGEKPGAIWTVVAFFGGMLLITLIDKLIPKEKNPHDLKDVNKEVDCEEKDACKNVVCEKVILTEKDEDKSKAGLYRVGILTALAIAVHNFPEGLATFVSALQTPSLAVPIVIAIAIHNIPEGISVSVPIYCSTGSKKKAVLLSFLSGLAEPFGAVIAYLVLMPFLSDVMFGILFAMVAGIMVFISLDELLPSAREYGENHLAIYGLVSGMVVMAISLLIFM